MYFKDAHKMEIEEPKTLIEVVPTSDAPALPPKPKPSMHNIC